MGNKDAKILKTFKSSTEQTPGNEPTTAYPDWSAFQAYYGVPGNVPIASHGAFPPLPPNAHGNPYMWCPQVFPPYGSPPFVSMYPPGVLYPPHPSIQGAPPHPFSPYTTTSNAGTAEASAPVASGTKVEENKRKGSNSLKRSRRSLGSQRLFSERANGIPKLASDVAICSIISQSNENGTEGSSQGSDSISQEDLHNEQSARRVEDDIKNGSPVSGTNDSKETPNFLPLVNHPMPWIALPAMPGTPPYFNTGADNWNGTPKSTIRRRRRSAHRTVDSPSSLVVLSNGAQSDGSLHDDRDLKRERRKQSNRESARRSRLRKLAESEELSQNVAALKEENDTLRKALGRKQEECLKLASDNAALTEKLQRCQCLD